MIFLNILMIFGIKSIILTHTMYCWLLLHTVYTSATYDFFYGPGSYMHARTHSRAHTHTHTHTHTRFTYIITCLLYISSIYTALSFKTAIFTMTFLKTCLCQLASTPYLAFYLALTCFKPGLNIVQYTSCWLAPMSPFALSLSILIPVSSQSHTSVISYPSLKGCGRARHHWWARL